MQTKNSKKWLSCIFAMALVVAMALVIAGCGGKDSKGASDAGSRSEGGVMGEGETSFDFAVVDLENKETKFEIHTGKETVGEALQELGIIEGEEGEFGLYVKTVNGVTLDYDTDGKYWAFYINGEYATSGVELTSIAEGESYSFKAE